MNKWKPAFWICLSLLVFVTGYSLYTIVDHGVTLAYYDDSYTSIKSDLETVIGIVNNTDMSKAGIESELAGHKYREYMDFSSDTIALSSVFLIFDNGRLKQIQNQNNF